MEKKNIFEAPEAIVITFDDSDIITGSGFGDEEDPYHEWNNQPLIIQINHRRGFDSAFCFSFENKRHLLSMNR